VASPNRKKVAIAGTASGKLNRGPNNIETVMAKIEIAIIFKEVSFIIGNW